MNYQDIIFKYDSYGCEGLFLQNCPICKNCNYIDCLLAPGILTDINQGIESGQHNIFSRNPGVNRLLKQQFHPYVVHKRYILFY